MLKPPSLARRSGIARQLKVNKFVVTALAVSQGGGSRTATLVSTAQFPQHQNHNKVVYLPCPSSRGTMCTQYTSSGDGNDNNNYWQSRSPAEMAGFIGRGLYRRWGYSNRAQWEASRRPYPL